MIEEVIWWILYVAVGLLVAYRAMVWMYQDLTKVSSEVGGLEWGIITFAGVAVGIFWPVLLPPFIVLWALSLGVKRLIGGKT